MQKIDDYILQIIKTKNPEDVKQLMEYVQQESVFDKREILDRLVALRNDGKITLTAISVSPVNVYAYAVSLKLAWFWATVEFTVLTIIFVLGVPESFFPLTYIRPIIGTFFVLLLPGYSLIQAIFPAEKLDTLERIGISIGTSLGLVSLDAFVLNFSPWKITLTSIVFSLALITLLSVTCAFLIHLSRFQKVT